MKTRIFTTFIGFLLVFAWGCRKDIDSFTPYENESGIGEQIEEEIGGEEGEETNDLPYSGDVNKLFEELGVKSQFYSINIDHSDCITGEKGTIICFSASSLIDLGGSIVSGSVDVELKEIYDQKDMVASNKHTVANGRILVSGGEIFLKVTQNDEELKLLPTATTIVQMPIDDTNDQWWNNDMSVFYGTESEDGSIDWGDAQAQAFVAETPIINDTINTFYGLFYQFTIDRFDWINCDYFYDEPNITPISIKVPNNYNNTNTAVFLVFTDINSVAGIYNFNNEGNYFYSGGGYEVPIGMNVTIVAISEQGEDEWKAVFESITVQEDHIVSLNNFTLMTLEEIENQLLNL